MPDHNGKLIIAGAGQAGYWVAATVRSLVPEREIILVGDEPHLPYERPPLSKGVLTGKDAFQSAHFKSAEFFDDNRIDLRMNTHVEQIDREGKSVTLSDGRSESYDELVIATGSRPRTLSIPGANHPRVVSLRTMADLGAIRAGLGPRKHLVAVGAGFIGLEVASSAKSLGNDVTVVEMQSQALGRLVAPEVAHAIVARHAQHGVTFRFCESTTAIADDAGRLRMQMSSGADITADLVLVGIGAVPNDGLAREADIRCEDGVLVDETGVTSDPNIYAVGDVCRQFNTGLGRVVRLESWQNAQNQAIAVGKRIAGQPEPYHEVPWFWTDQYDFNFQIVGVPESWDKIIWRGSPDDETFTAIYLKDGLVVGGNTFNNGRDIRPLKTLILENLQITPELLSNSSISLVKILKMVASQ